MYWIFGLCLAFIVARRILRWLLVRVPVPVPLPLPVPVPMLEPVLLLEPVSVEPVPVLEPVSVELVPVLEPVPVELVPVLEPVSVELVPVLEPVSMLIPMAVPIIESVHELVPEPVPESTPEPMLESTPEPVQVPMPGSMPTRPSEIIESEEDSIVICAEIGAATRVENQASTTVNVVNRGTWTTAEFMLLLFLGGIIAGYPLGVLGGVLAFPQYLVNISHKILRNQRQGYRNNFCNYYNLLLPLHTSIIPLVAAFGAVSTLYLNQWGRRSALNGGLVLLLVGIGCMCWFPHIVVDIVGHMFAGFGLGIVSLVLPAIALESLQENVRKHGAILFLVSTGVGGFLAVVNNFVASHYHVWGWRFSLGFVAIPTIGVLALSLHIKETPQYYLKRNHIRQAKNALKILRGQEDVEGEFQDLLDANERNKDKKALKEIFRKENRPVLVIITFTTVLTKALGVEVLAFYSAFILQSLNFKIHEAYVGPMILTATVMFSNSVGVYLIRAVGRKPTYIVACLISFFSMISFAVIFYQNADTYDHLEQSKAVGVAVPVILYFLASGVLPGPLDWLETTFTEDCSDLGSVYSMALSLVLTAVINHALLPVLCSFGVKTFFALLPMPLLLMLFTIAFIPETKGLKQEEMVDVWRRHWFWSRWL